MVKANVNQDSNESFDLTGTSRTFYKPAYTLYNTIIELKVNVVDYFCHVQTYKGFKRVLVGIDKV